MKKIFFYLSAVLLIINFSCNNQNKSQRLESKDLLLQNSSSDSKTFDQSLSLDTVGNSNDNCVQTKLPAENNDWDKKIIKTANLKIEVKDLISFNNIVHKAAKQYGGYIASEEQNQSEDKLEIVISLKVPVDEFESLLNNLPADKNKTIEKKITSQDVTGEVIDVKSRLEAKQQMRIKYLDFLKQSKNMEDVLKVQKEINGIQEDIESASGRINYLSHQSAYSTINITFFQPLPGYKPADKIPGLLTRISEAFKTGYNFMAEIIIGLISIWPLILVIILTVILLKKRKLSPTNFKQTL